MRTLAYSSPAIALLCLGCSLLNPPQTRDLCAKNRSRCDPMAACASDASSFHCTCPKGYRDVHGDGSLCHDRDECADGTARCDALARCDNQPGSFKCVCPEGYIDHDQGSRCEEIDACQAGLDNCDRETQACQKLDGAGFRCTCKTGFELNPDGSCRDIDECATGSAKCEAPAECENRPGSYACRCPLSLTQLTPTSCEQIDPCEAGRRSCGEHTSCVASSGGQYSCECLPGYERTTSSLCDDVDECKNNPCQEGATCTNLSGSFECHCEGYYQLSDDGRRCIDRRLTRVDTLNAHGRVQVLADGKDNLFLAGSFVNAIELCGRSYPVVGQTDVFIVKYDAARNCQWVHTFGDISWDELLGATLDPSGNPVLTATYFGKLDLHGASVDSNGYRGRVVAKLDGADGHALWAHSFLNLDPDDAGANYPESTLSADRDGNVLWAGRIPTGIELESPNHVNGSIGDSTDWDALLVTLDANDGSVRRWTAFGGTGSAMATGVAVDPAGDLLLAGFYQWELDIDGHKLPGIDTWQGFVAKLSTQGHALWWQQINGKLDTAWGFDRSTKLTVATTSDGTVILSGSYREALHLRDSFTSLGFQDLLLAALEGSTGNAVWVKSFGGVIEDQPGQMAVDSNDRIVVTGEFAQIMQLGDQLLYATRDSDQDWDRDLFVASFDATGTLRWAQRFGGKDNERAAALAVAPAGEIYVSSAFTPPILINGKQVPTPGSEPVFVLQLDP